MEPKCCNTCLHFDRRTHFCRYNPPVPIVFYETNGNRTIQNVSSKWVVITKPELDYCSFYKIKDKAVDDYNDDGPNYNV